MLRNRFVLIVLYIITLPVFSQTGNGNGQYNELIDKSYLLLDLLKNTDKNELIGQFQELNFQTNKEFKQLLNTSNFKWIRNIIYCCPIKNVSKKNGANLLR